MTTVSVVTPSYNQASFIRETLRSVQQQRYEHTEHIVVDGDSDDGTQSILTEFDIEWYSEPDDGQADAINKGFEHVSGDIVGWLNSDDVYFDIGVVERVVEYFEQTDADIIYGDVAILDADSTVHKLWAVPEFDYERLSRYCFLEQPAVFFRRHVLEEHRLDPGVDIVVDYEFWLRLGREYSFEHVPDVLAGDRNHSGRKSIALREEMAADARRVRRRHGYRATPPQLARLSDLLRAGIPRRIDSLARTIQLRREPRTLAFDGEFRPLPVLLGNAVRPNRGLG